MNKRNSKEGDQESARTPRGVAVLLTRFETFVRSLPRGTNGPEDGQDGREAPGSGEAER
jgi:hypothetical protein